jgi:hypothetical protein
MKSIFKFSPWQRHDSDGTADQGKINTIQTMNYLDREYPWTSDPE